MGEGERASAGGYCVRAVRSYVGGDMGVQCTAQYRVGASYDAHDILCILASTLVVGIIVWILIEYY